MQGKWYFLYRIFFKILPALQRNVSKTYISQNKREKGLFSAQKFGNIMTILR
jgi:hypothetical protein